MMMILGVDHYDMNRNLDVVQYNHYHYPRAPLAGGVLVRLLGRSRSAVLEHRDGHLLEWRHGATGLQRAWFCRANRWMPIAMGGEANLYWLWRSHWAGQELMHGSVLSSSGRPMHIFDEVKEVAEGLQGGGGLHQRHHATRRPDSGCTSRTRRT